MASFLRFPPDFTWGAATSSYQIEGAVDQDGRSDSIWDTFCRQPGAVRNGDSGEVACDHYNHFRQDVALMAELNLRAYRFSIAWPRVLPEGRGRVEERGLDFYDRLVDELLAKGIEPWLTLYHWDLPQVLQDQGGWTSRETCGAFVELAQAVSRRLGDRVKHWITHNEPWVVAHLGHLTGEHAPGLKSGPAMVAASHHVLLSHGQAVPVIREHAPGAAVGITLNLMPAVPASASAADGEAARHLDGTFNRWYLDPIFGRGYPGDIVGDYATKGFLSGQGVAEAQPGDLDTIASPIDFLGVNFYSRAIVRDDSAPPERQLPVAVFEEAEHTEMGWEVHPPSLTALLLRLHRDYPAIPLVITENGCSYSGEPDEDGVVKDPKRVSYLSQHLAACHAAIAQGVDLGGYFAWSLLDNFEWAHGYAQRFGIVHVDYETQRRTPKESARWYAGVIVAERLEPPA